MEVPVGEPNGESTEKVDIVGERIFFGNWPGGSSDNTRQPLRLSWYTSFVGVVGSLLHRKITNPVPGIFYGDDGSFLNGVG